MKIQDNGLAEIQEEVKLTESEQESVAERVVEKLREEPPKFFVSLGTKINIGNYENFDFSFGVSNLSVYSSDEAIEEACNLAMAKTKDVMNIFYMEMADRIQKIKAAHS